MEDPIETYFWFWVDCPTTRHRLTRQSTLTLRHGRLISKKDSYCFYYYFININKIPPFSLLKKSIQFGVRDIHIWNNWVRKQFDDPLYNFALPCWSTDSRHLKLIHFLLSYYLMKFYVLSTWDYFISKHRLFFVFLFFFFSITWNSKGILIITNCSPSEINAYGIMAEL